MVNNKNVNSRDVVQVKRSVLTNLLTCSICNNIFNDPVNITECLHIFCNTCIRKKIEEEHLNRCPVCNIYLGCRPLDKLRPDHSWSSIRATIAPSLSKRSKKCNNAEGDSKEKELSERAEQAAPQLGKRKKRCPSSLASESEVSVPAPSKRKAQRRKVSSSHESPISIEKLNESGEGCSDGSGLAADSSKSGRSKKQSFGRGSSKQQIPPIGKGITQKVKSCPNNQPKPLNLAEVEIITISDKSASEGQISKSEGMSSGRKSRTYNADSVESTQASGSVSRTRKTRGRPKRSDIKQELDLNAPPQSTTDTASNQPGKRVVPVWLSLVRSLNQEGIEPLPQIPSCFLMIKNSNLPVSYIKKYLVQKLNLACEDEVVISLFGADLPSDMQLSCLVDQWSKIISHSEKLHAVVGGSAQEFVMVLSYGRRRRCQG